MTRYKGLSNSELAQMTLYERIIIHTIPHDGHLLWCGNQNIRGNPMFALSDGEKKTNILVRRYLFMQEYPEIENPWIKNNLEICGEPQCVLPAHQVDARHRKRGVVGVTPVRQIRSLRVTLIQNLAKGGYTPQEIAVGLKLNLATVKRIINASKD